MGKYVASYRLLRVDCICHSATRVSCDLVGDKDGHVELLTDFLQPTENSTEYLLSLGKFSST